MISTFSCRPAKGAAAFAAILLGFCWASSQAAAEQSGDAAELGVELNKMEEHGTGGCRLSFVFRNGTDERLDTFKLDLVMFGQDDVIARRLIVDASPLRSGKTTVKLFDVDGLTCGDIATILVNDLPGCVLGREGSQDCIEVVALQSRAEATLTK